MTFFDCDASYGILDVPPQQYAETPEQLLAEMDFCNVDEALVTCAAQRCDSPIVGNELVVRETEGHSCLHPAWVILPPQTGELAHTVDAFIADMGRNGVRALWAFPARNHYSLNATTFGPLFEELSERNVPLFLPVPEMGGGSHSHTSYYLGWKFVDELLAQFPRLTLVATDQSVWGQDRYFRPLVERYPRFYLDIATYEQGRGLEDFCRKYGPGRLLFGTHYPEVPMGGPVLNVANADISDRDKELIAGGNLRRLLQEVRL